MRSGLVPGAHFPTKKRTVHAYSMRLQVVIVKIVSGMPKCGNPPVVHTISDPNVEPTKPTTIRVATRKRV
ncbi:hypothetical protein CHU98_g5935 [Xylaria longipes]|nr:hypothetical protein CHU98_g5935 [Xylaria longipes]